MPIFGSNNHQPSTSGGRKNGSTNAKNKPAMSLRGRLRGNQRIAPQTNGVDSHDQQQQHQRHVARSTFGQQHHSSRPSAWVIPFEQEEIVPSYSKATAAAIATLPSADDSSFDSEEDDGLPIITPDRTTPCASNRKNNNPNKTSIKRGLHNSHRKQRLHHIAPRLVVSTQQQVASTQQQRGNGVVLDLTSLFTGDSKGPQSPSDSKTATTAASTNPQRQQQASPFVHGPKSPISFAYNAPVPPWRNRNRAAASPVTTASEQKNSKDMDTFDNSSIVNVLQQNNKEDLQWDSKSQTTQEALLTQRQSQALTQWLNFVLVGEQEQQQMQEEALASNKKGRRKASFDEDELRSRATTPTGAGRSLANTPTPGGGRSVKSRSTTPSRTPGGRSVATTPPSGKQNRLNTPGANTPTRPCTPSGRSVASGTTTGRATPGASGRSIASISTTGRATPGALASPSNATQLPANRRRHRRLSLFQYAESYEHAQDQAHHWFQHSPQWKELRRRIRMEISSGKLTLRDDRNLYANVGCRDILLELFCYYKPAWLTLALEVVMNDPIVPPQGLSLPTNKQLKNFIVHKVLMDAKLLSKYTQGRGSGTPSGKFEKAFQAELRPLVLYRILVLVFFLDRAAVKFQAQNNQLGNLFLATAKIKSTTQVLVTICREFLSRQGDIVKQLARVNLHVYYKQHRLDEIEYPIVNFAVDLRDGLRLCRVVEVLWLLPRRHGYLLNNQNSGGGIDLKVKYPLLHQLRIPAISRLQKIHNVNVALGALQEQCQVGLPSDLQAHHIVDGQRRMVMRLVWTIVLMHCFESSELLTPEQVEDEIAMAQDQRDHNKEMQERRRQHQQDQNNSSLCVLERESDGMESLALVSHDASKTTVQVAGGRPPANNLQPMLSQSRSSSFDEDDASKSTLGEIPIIQKWKGLLFQWCQEVCMLVDEEEKVNSSLSGAERPPKKTNPDQWTTTDLANGKALCCLIHHYHPTILPMEDLRLASRVVNGPPTRIETSSTFTLTALRHQRQSPNIAPDYYMRLAQRRLNEIGGIPPMMLLPLDKAAKGHNQRKKPSVVALGEEKSILVFLYHVCARLIESRHQVQAVVFVQQRYRYLRNVTLWRQQLQAAKFILRAWRANKSNYFLARERKYRKAVAIIEEFVSLNFCKLLILQENRLNRDLKNLAVTPIQALVRRFLSNKNLQEYFLRKAAATKIQAQFRRFHAYQTCQILLLELKPAATVLQRHWRGYVQRRTYASIIDATIILQSFLHGAIVKQRIQLWNASATCIQKIWKGFWDQLHYQMDLLDILAVQCLVRKQQAIQSARTKAHAVGVLQRNVRSFLARESLRKRIRERHASTIIQKSVRRMLAIREAAKRRAALALLRATLVIQRSWRRAAFLRERELGALKIQTCFRSWTALAVYVAIRAFAITIQTQWRKYSQRKKYLATISSIIIQAQWRRFAQMKKYRELRSAIRVQAEWRCFAQMNKYRALRSTIRLQTQWRRFAQQKKYLALVSTIKIQTQWRRVAQQQKYHMLRSTIKIQAQWRRHASQTKYRALISAITIQSQWRRCAQQKKYCALTSAIKLQSHWRQYTQQKKYRALISAIRIQKHWRQYAQVKVYTALIKSVITLQSCLRRWKYGVVETKRRRSALQMVQNCFRAWLASRLLKSMKNQRDCTIRSAILCQSLARRNLCSKAWNASKLAALTLQTTWRRYWCLKIFSRRRDLVSALSKSDLFFRHFQKGSFKIVPHTRQVVGLSKQTIIRCGKKRIALSNASTWAVPWRGRRQKLFRHRSHVEAVRLKHSSGIALSNLPRRPITLRMLRNRNANGAAKGFQAPWIHIQLTLYTRATRRQISREKFARIHTKRRTKCARKILSTSIESKARRTFDANEVTLAKTFRREMMCIQTTNSRVQRCLHTPTRRLRQYVTTSRVLNLLKRHTTLSLSNKSISSSDVQLFEDPFKKKIKMGSAAEIVQKHWRCFAAKKHLGQDLRHVVIIQSTVRQYLAKQLCTAARAITAMIQAAVRGFLVRQLLKKQHMNATTVQRYWRGSSAQSKYHTISRAVRENAAAKRIQATARGCMVRRELLMLRVCAMIVQKSARGWLAREQVKPAIRNLRNGKMAAKIQQVWRGHSQRLKFQKATKSVVIAQSAVRRWRAQRQLRQLLQKEWEMVAMESAVKIQAAWRSFSRRIDFMFTILCLVKIQSWWRPIVQQKFYRRANERRLLEHKHNAAATIQSSVRVLLAKRSVAKLRASQKVAVATIQRCVRGFLARQQLSLENFAATEIQRVWRGYDDESGYIYVIVSAIKVQSFCRMANAKKKRQAFLLENLQKKVHEYAPGTSVQSTTKFCRRMSAQKLASESLKVKMRQQHEGEVRREEQEEEEAALRQKCAVKIQSVWRMVLAIQKATNLAISILEEEGLLQPQSSMIPPKVHGVVPQPTAEPLARLDVPSTPSKPKHQDAVPEETKTSTPLQPQKADKPRKAVKKLPALSPHSQSSKIPPPKVHCVVPQPTPGPQARLDVPSTPSTPKHRDIVPEETKASTPFRAQKEDKPRKAVKKLPALSPRAKAELHQRLSLSQGLVRGFLARRQSDAAVREVQVLIKEAELRSRLHPSMRLGARMVNALSVLKTSRSLTEIMNVVCTIELATRFSKECCAEFVQAGATEILVALLYDLNKSLPHVELLYYLMRTLLNVCKYRSMVNHVANVETAKAFLHLIRMYGSEDAVFCSAVSLLEVCASHNEDVRALIASPSSKRRMEGICRQWERKLDRRLAMESPSSGLSTPQRMSREAPSQNVYTPQFMSQRNKAKTDMLILGISYDLQNGVATFRQVLSRTT